MKLIHLSDLHLGKQVNGFSMIDDQKYILKEILRVIDEEAPDAVLIAGDIYDKPLPAVEAVKLLDSFLSALMNRRLPVFLISGNHDSAERLAFGSDIMKNEGLYIAPTYDGTVKPVTLQDEWGDVRIYMLPFIKPVHMRAVLRSMDREQKEIDAVVSYTDAVRAAIREMHIDPGKRNVLITHQFITGAETSDSEERSVGGADNVDASVFRDFDYVALGHIHRPQYVERETIRYCGTPLKYSFSEAGHEKSVTVAELGDKGEFSWRAVPLAPLRDMREIRGTYDELTLKQNYENTETDDYVHITLTNEEEILEAVARMRTIYPNLMRLDYDNQRTRASDELQAAEETEQKTPLELFGDLFEMQNGKPMTTRQKQYAGRIIEEVWEEEQ